MTIFHGPPNPRPKPLPRPKGNIMFKVMMDEREWKTFNTDQLPKQLPMAFMAQFRVRIMKTHNQTIERLNERGGLTPTEICAAMYDKNFFTYWGNVKITDEQTKFAINMIVMKLNNYIKEQATKGG
jgi:Asp-tRNA(Asn)/Glu-tRNA(Gln) amidotransferase B subunit